MLMISAFDSKYETALSKYLCVNKLCIDNEYYDSTEMGNVVLMDSECGSYGMVYLSLFPEHSNALMIL